MGGGKNDQKEPQASKAQAAIAQQLFNQTNPIRNMLIGDTISFLGGDPASMNQQNPLFPPSPMDKLSQIGSIIGGHHQGGLGGKAGRSDTPMTSSIMTRGPMQYNVAGTPEFQYIQDAANRRFDQAKQSTLANQASGGALNQSLSDTALERARTLTGAESDIFNRNLDRAYSLATGQPFTGSGLGTAAAIQAQIAQANASQNAAAKGGIGQGVGYGLGAK